MRIQGAVVVAIVFVVMLDFVFVVMLVLFFFGVFVFFLVMLTFFLVGVFVSVITLFLVVVVTFFGVVVRRHDAQKRERRRRSVDFPLFGNFHMIQIERYDVLRGTIRQEQRLTYDDETRPCLGVDWICQMRFADQVPICSVDHVEHAVVRKDIQRTAIVTKCRCHTVFGFRRRERQGHLITFRIDHPDAKIFESALVTRCGFAEEVRRIFMTPNCPDARAFREASVVFDLPMTELVIMLLDE